MILVDLKALYEFREPGPCETCGRPQWRREASHAMARGRGFQFDHWINLTGSCHDCHTGHHTQGVPSQADLIAAIARREGTTLAVVAKVLQLVRWAEKVSNEEAKRRTAVIIAHVGGARFAERPYRPVLSNLDRGDGLYLPPYQERSEGFDRGLAPD